MGTLKNTLFEFVDRFLETSGFELVDLVVKGKRESTVIQCFADKEGGITLQECVRLNHLLIGALEAECEKEGIVLDRLEVSSPGIDRPLKSERDYRRNINRTISIQYRNEDGSQKVEGTLLGISGDRVVIRYGDSEIQIPFASIDKANVKTNW
jgi:ribosome maturation factor RimP